VLSSTPFPVLDSTSSGEWGDAKGHNRPKNESGAVLWSRGALVGPLVTKETAARCILGADDAPVTSAMIALGIAGAVAAGVIILASAHRENIADTNRFAGSDGVATTGGARVGSWYVSAPLAEMIVAPSFVVIRRRFKRVPLATVVLERDQAGTIELRKGLVGSTCLRITDTTNATCALFFCRSDAKLRASLEQAGWTLREVPGRSWFGWT
jgi:hypothetical protein